MKLKRKETAIENYIKIPEKILKDDNLTPIAKLLYGKIYSLQQGDVGACIATSDKLAELIKSSRISVIRALNQLEKGGYIRRFNHANTRTLFALEIED